MVELCSSRISILSMDEEMLLREAKSLNREKVISIPPDIASDQCSDQTVALCR
jgi:hypothetical protein